MVVAVALKVCNLQCEKGSVAMAAASAWQADHFRRSTNIDWMMDVLV
jgi:hypothetical protein